MAFVFRFLIFALIFLVSFQKSLAFIKQDFFKNLRPKAKVLYKLFFFIFLLNSR